MNKKYTFRTNTPLLMGDTHSPKVAYHLLQRLGDNHDIVHLGDVGLGFGDHFFAEGNARIAINNFNNLCKEKNINLYLNRGNHDAPWVWEFENMSNVFFLQDGDCGIFPNGKKVLLIGGGISIDRCNRTQGLDYWKDEVTKLVENVEKCDFIFSHDCPEYFNHSTDSLEFERPKFVSQDDKLIIDCYKQRNIITDIVERSGAKKIYYGHFHNDEEKEVNGIFGKCININVIYEFNAEL